MVIKDRSVFSYRPALIIDILSWQFNRASISSSN